jgi:hypothetical protein
VLSLEDGKTYERAAVARRNLSRAAHERQAAAWATAKAHAVASLAEDASLTLVGATHQTQTGKSTPNSAHHVSWQSPLGFSKDV